MANKAKQSAKAAGIEMNKTHVKPGHVVAYIVLVLISIVWLLPFAGIVLQSFRSFTLEYGGMVDYLLPKTFSLDSYTWLYKMTVNDTNYCMAAVIGIMVFVVTAVISLAVYGMLPSVRDEEGFQ